MLSLINGPKNFKIMIFHYVNLLNWNWIYFNTYRSRSIINIDSLSLLFCIRLIVKNAVLERRSGVKMWKELEKNEVDIFLVSHSIGLERECVLPIFRSSEEIENWYSENQERLKKVQNIVIGISSPMQDKLAVYIHSKKNVNVQLDIYCLGAALYNEHNLVFDKLMMNWFIMLLNNPRRFLLKIKLTALEMISLTNKKNRSDFKNFVKIFLI